MLSLAKGACDKYHFLITSFNKFSRSILIQRNSKKASISSIVLRAALSSFESIRSLLFGRVANLS
jgi:hypothetical protein